MNSTPPRTPLPAALPALANFRFQLRGFLSFSESAAESLGTTSQQYQLLQVVGESAPTGVSITRIAERLLLRHNSVVELVDRAQRAALVTRAGDPQDHRRLVVALTAKGSLLLHELVQRHLAFLQCSGPTLIGSLEQVLAQAMVPEPTRPEAERTLC